MLQKVMPVIAVLQEDSKIHPEVGYKVELSGSIEFKDVVFCYPTRKEVKILNEFNLKIERG